MTAPVFLAPTRAKVAITAGCFLLFPAVMLLRAIPPQLDLLDLRQWSGMIPALLVGVPIRLFNLLTGSAFASRSEGFLALPNVPELAAAFLADVLLFYLIACTWVHWRARRRSRHELGSMG